MINNKPKINMHINLPISIKRKFGVWLNSACYSF